MPGINVAQLSYQYSEKNDFYSHGNKVQLAVRPPVSSSIYSFRVGRSFEVAQMPAFFYAQASSGAVHPDGMPSDKGLTDTTMAFAIWPYVNRETQTYFGAALYWVVPTGSYDSNQLFSMGENRHKVALQIGYQQPLAEKMSWMTAFDALWYGSNTDAPILHQKLEQDTLYSAQFGLRYDFNPQYALTGTYYYSTGGETSLDGVDRNDATRVHRYQISGVANYSFGRITVQYGSDLKTDNGYYEDHRLNLRYTLRF